MGVDPKLRELVRKRKIDHYGNLQGRRSSTAAKELLENEGG
jgi:hypothetical protein